MGKRTKEGMEDRTRLLLDPSVSEGKRGLFSSTNTYGAPTPGQPLRGTEMNMTVSDFLLPPRPTRPTFREGSDALVPRW